MVVDWRAFPQTAPDDRFIIVVGKVRATGDLVSVSAKWDEFRVDWMVLIGDGHALSDYDVQWLLWTDYPAPELF